MFCRYCGAHIADDSLFCAKCGKRLGKRVNPRVEKTVRVLRLNTPYPYFAVMFLLFAGYMIGSRKPRLDYSHIKLTMEAERNLDRREDNLFQQGFALQLENTGSTTMNEIRVDLTARIEPAKPAEVIANYRGQNLPIMEAGKARPYGLVLAGQVNPGSKRQFGLGGSIQAEPPFKVTYEIREEDSETVLASYVVER
jgi:hypothetical protein